MNKPKLIIPKLVFDKVMHWVHLAGNREISGLGKLTYDPQKNQFEVIDAHVLKQTIQTSGNTEIDAAAIGKFMYETREQGPYVWWWHSHHSMGAFWSGTDRECINSFGRDGGVVATVFNNKSEHLSACQFKVTSMLGESQIFYDKLDTEILTYYPQDYFNQWKAEYDAAKIDDTVQQYINHGHRRWDNEPPKKLRKLWEKVPESFRKDIVFETTGKNPEEWVWMPYSKDWRKAVEYDFQTAKGFWSPQDVKDYLKTTQQQLNLPADGLDDDDDMPDMDDQARLLSGMSEAEWSMLERDEKLYWQSGVELGPNRFGGMYD